MYVSVHECADVRMCADVSVCAFVDHMPMIARCQLWVLLFLLGYHPLHFLRQHLPLALNCGLDLVGWPAIARNPPAVVLQWLALKGTTVPHCFLKIWISYLPCSFGKISDKSSFWEEDFIFVYSSRDTVSCNREGLAVGPVGKW